MAGGVFGPIVEFYKNVRRVEIEQARAVKRKENAAYNADRLGRLRYDKGITRRFTSTSQLFGLCSGTGQYHNEASFQYGPLCRQNPLRYCHTSR